MKKVKKKEQTQSHKETRIKLSSSSFLFLPNPREFSSVYEKKERPINNITFSTKRKKKP